MGRKAIRRGPGKRRIDAKEFYLADEIEYIRRHAAAYDGRFVTVGPLALFSTYTGDAWLLDPVDHLAARVARDGHPEEIYFEEPIRTSLSAGRANTASTATFSSTSIGIPAASYPSSAIRATALRNWVDAGSVFFR